MSNSNVEASIDNEGPYSLVAHSDQDILCHSVSPYSPYPEDQTTGSHPLFYLNMFSPCNYGRKTVTVVKPTLVTVALTTLFHFSDSFALLTEGLTVSTPRHPTPTIQTRGLSNLAVHTTMLHTCL